MTKLAVDFRLHTDGSGLWSRSKVEVNINQLELVQYDEEQDYGELRVHFDPSNWDTSLFGLIYTDDLFLEELKTQLELMGIEPDVDYSEQGMQGYSYVSLDANLRFVKSFKNRVSMAQHLAEQQKKDAENWRKFCQAIDECKISVILENADDSIDGGVIVTSADDVLEYIS